MSDICFLKKYDESRFYWDLYRVKVTRLLGKEADLLSELVYWLLVCQIDGVKD